MTQNLLSQVEREKLIESAKQIYLEAEIEDTNYPITVHLFDLTIGGYGIGAIKKTTAGSEWEAFTELGESALKILNQLINSLKER